MRRVRGSAYYAGNRVLRNQVASLNPKFKPGEDPLERELKIPVIVPTDKQQLDTMTRMLEKEFGGPNATPQQTQALELWKIQVAQGTVTDQVKLQFLKRFFFWLLGRGDEDDHKKTLWGRANTAVYNKEVASYIDMFVDKRTQYVQKLLLLANNVPDTLYGYYLYFKYIVNGGLQQKKAPDGTINYDFSDEDYLQDFDIFQQVFDPEVKFQKLAAGIRDAEQSKGGLWGKAGVPGPINHENLANNQALVQDTSIRTSDLEKEDEEVLERRLSRQSSLNKPRKPFLDSRESQPVGKNEDDDVIQDPRERSAISSGTGPGAVEVNVNAATGGGEAKAAVEDFTDPNDTQTWAMVMQLADERIASAVKTMPPGEDRRQRLLKLYELKQTAMNEAKARRSSIRTPESAKERPRTPKSVSFSPDTSFSGDLDSPVDSKGKGEMYPSPEAPQTPMKANPRPPVRSDSSQERSLQEDLRKQEELEDIAQKLKKQVAAETERAVAYRKAAKLHVTMAKLDKDMVRREEQLRLAREALDASINATASADNLKKQIDPDLLGRSLDVSLSSTKSESSVSSADLAARADAEEQAAEGDAEDLNDDALEGSSANETDKSLSDLINNIEESVAPASESEEAPSKMTEDSSGSVSVKSDTSSGDSQSHQSIDVGGEKGKVVNRHGNFYVPIQNRQELIDRLQFHELNPTLAPAGGQHEKASEEYPNGRWVTKELVGYKPLNDFAKDKKQWSNEQKIKLRKAIFTAYHTLRGEWGDLSNPSNVAVKYDEANDQFDVKFYEGGRFKGPRTLTSEMDTIVKMGDLLRNVRRTLMDSEWNKLYGDFR